MNQIIGALNRLGRRLQMIGGAGVKTQDYGDVGPIQIIQVQTGPDEVMDVPRLAEFGFTSMPPNGASIALIFLSGDRSNGVAIASGDISSRPKGLAPGESMLYSQDGKYIYLTASSGIIIEAKDQDITVNNAKKVTVNSSSDVTVNCGGNLVAEVTGNAEITAPNIILNGTVQINGDAIIDGAVTVTEDIVATGDVSGNGISLDAHIHPVAGVQGGDSTIATGVPE